MYLESLPSQGAAQHQPYLGQAGLIENIEAATVRAFVRGTLPVEALQDGGLRARNASNSRIAIRAADIAAGIVTLRPHQAALSEWASFMLLILERFSYEPDDAAFCERLVAEIWDLSFGAPLKDSIARLAFSLNARNA